MVQIQASTNQPLLVFVHIRKTAGKTLRQILYRQYGRRQTRLVYNYFTRGESSHEAVRELAASVPPGLRVAHGHMLFWSDVSWPTGTQFFTLLRHPVERVISHYFWTRARKPTFARTLAEAVSDGHIVDNLQTRVLAASMPPFGETTEATLDQALRSLDRLTVLGLTDRFDESLVLLTRAFGWEPMPYTRENVTPDRQPRETISSDVIELIERHNELDLELYRQATGRFDDEVAGQPDDFHIEVAALMRANARLAGTSEEAPPDGRLAAVDAATETVRLRLHQTEKKLRALENAGDAADAARLEELRRVAAKAEKRLRAFEQRRERIRRRTGARKGQR